MGNIKNKVLPILCSSIIFIGAVSSVSAAIVTLDPDTHEVTGGSITATVSGERGKTGWNIKLQGRLNSYVGVKGCGVTKNNPSETPFEIAFVAQLNKTDYNYRVTYLGKSGFVFNKAG